MLCRIVIVAMSCRYLCDQHLPHQRILCFKAGDIHKSHPCDLFLILFILGNDMHIHRDMIRCEVIGMDMGNQTVTGILQDLCRFKRQRTDRCPYLPAFLLSVPLR